VSRLLHGHLRAGAALLYRAGAARAMQAAGDRWKLVRNAGGRRWVRRTSPPFPILIYHRVNPWPSSFAIDVTPPDRFRRQMEHLARRYRVLPLEELWRRTQEGSLPARSVAVTFDDGYADNHEFALPILRDLGVPATVFVVTGCVGTGVIPWHDRVLAAFERTSRTEAALPGDPMPATLVGVGARRSAAFRVLGALKPLEEPERLAGVARVEASLGAGAGAAEAGRPLMLDWDQVRAMRRGGFAIGSHTVSHPILSRQSPERVWAELTRSKMEIENAIGEPVTLFAYPNGRPEDYTPETVSLVRRAGYRVAVTTTFGVNDGGDDPLLWKRGTPWESDQPRYALKLAYYRLLAAPDLRPSPLAGASAGVASGRHP